MFSNKNTIIICIIVVIIVIFCLSMLSENFATSTYTPSADGETWYYYDTKEKKYYKVTTNSYDDKNVAKDKCKDYSTREYKSGGKTVKKYACIPSSTNTISKPELINTNNVFCKSTKNNSCTTLTSISNDDGSKFTLSGEKQIYNNIEYASTFTCMSC
jgi:hypothetical protein